jgi:hypothetical protein
MWKLNKCKYINNDFYFFLIYKCIGKQEESEEIKDERGVEPTALKCVGVVA